MHTQRIAILLLGFCGLLAAPVSGWGQGFLPFGPRVESDPKKTYTLTENDGPWLIMVGSFAGSEGLRQAQDLVLEIRQELRQPAYVYRHKIDYDEHQEGLGWQAPPDRAGQPIRQKMKLLNLHDFEEIAVLVGDFDAHDSPKAQKTLSRIKSMQPQTLMNASERAESAFLQQRIKRHFQRPQEDEAGPLRSAFICPNPMLPEEYFNPKGPDRFVYNLNKDLDYSLLRCPKQYSLRVATFKGAASFNLEEIEAQKKEFNLKRMLGQPIKSQLAEAADRAHRLTLALRERGIEAYEFHDRYSSFVCVGSFDDLTVLGPNGQQQWNPQLVNLVQTFQPQPIKGSLRDADGNVVEGTLKPYTLPGHDDIPFDYVPEPIEVPHYSVARDYAPQDNYRR